MINNISIGQYYPVKSKIHRLDPRVKIIGVIVFITMMFICNNYFGYLLGTVSLLSVIKLSNVPFKLVFRSLKGVMVIIIFTVVLNLFFNRTGTVIFDFYFITVTREGFYNAIGMALRLMIIIMASSVLTLTTSPIELTDGIEYLFKPLKVVKFPVHEVAMMMTIALRFIPTLVEELNKIMKAQMARGASFDTGTIFEKAKSLVPVLVPLFISSFRRADELAMAMESRCYRGDIGRTRMKQLKVKKNDIKALCLIILFGIILTIGAYKI